MRGGGGRGEGGGGRGEGGGGRGEGEGGGGSSTSLCEELVCVADPVIKVGHLVVSEPPAAGDGMMQHSRVANEDLKYLNQGKHT